LNRIEDIFFEGDIRYDDVWKYTAFMQRAGFEGLKLRYREPLTLKEALKVSEDEYVEVWIDGEFYINSRDIDAKDTIKFNETVKELHELGRLEFYKKRTEMLEGDPEIYIFDPGKNLKLVEDPAGGRISGEFSAERDVRYMPAREGMGRLRSPRIAGRRGGEANPYFRHLPEEDIQRHTDVGTEEEERGGWEQRSSYFPRQAQQERRELQPR